MIWVHTSWKKLPPIGHTIIAAARVAKDESIIMDCRVSEVVICSTNIIGIEIDPGRSIIIVERSIRAQHLERVAHKIEHNVEKERCEQEERAQNKLSKERLLHKKSELEINKIRACTHSKKDGCDDGIVEYNAERRIEETRRKLERVLAMTLPTFNSQHQGHIDKHLLTMSRHGWTKRCEHTHQIVGGIGERGTPKKNPAQHDEEESEEHLSTSTHQAEDTAKGFFFRFMAAQNAGHKKASVIKPPTNKCPISAVPQATDEEYNKRVAQLLCPRATTAAEWEINIIAKPRHQRDVPTLPKVADIARKVRVTEVLHQSDAEKATRTDCYIAITGEVTVDLKGKEKSAHQQIYPTGLCIIGEDDINANGALVGYNNLFEKAPQDLPHTIDGIGIGKRAVLLELRQQVSSALDRASHQLREETEISKEI